jgi:hydroxyacylglutathione hydrolase
MIHPDDAPMLTDPMQNLSGFFGPALTAPPADRLLAAGDSIAVGDLRLTVLHTPGHSPGSVSFYTEGHLFSGDTLFAGSIGRFDFPGGDRQRLLRSIRERLLVLPPDTAVYPGHGEETTVGDEAAYNPYLA